MNISEELAKFINSTNSERSIENIKFFEKTFNDKNYFDVSVLPTEADVKRLIHVLLKNNDLNLKLTNQQVAESILQIFATITQHQEYVLLNKNDVKFNELTNMRFGKVILGAQFIFSKFVGKFNLNEKCNWEKSKDVLELCVHIGNLIMLNASISANVIKLKIGEDEKKIKKMHDWFSGHKNISKEVALCEETRNEKFVEMFNINYLKLMENFDRFAKLWHSGKVLEWKVYDTSKFNDLIGSFGVDLELFFKHLINLETKDCGPFTFSLNNLANRNIFEKDGNYLISHNLLRYSFMRIHNIFLHGRAEFSFFEKTKEDSWLKWLSDQMGDILVEKSKEKLSKDWQVISEGLPSRQWAQDKGVDYGDIDLVISNPKIGVVLFCEVKWKTPSFYDFKSKSQGEESAIEQQEKRIKQFEIYAKKSFPDIKNWYAPIITINPMNRAYVSKKIFSMPYSSMQNILLDFDEFILNFIV